MYLPSSFNRSNTNVTKPDMVFRDSNGASIMVDVNDRLPEEYNYTAHDYTKEMIENGTKKVAPNFNILRSEKIYIDGQKAFLIEYVNGLSSHLKAIECFLFFKKYAFVITASAPEHDFENYRQYFEYSIKTLKLNNVY